MRKPPRTPTALLRQRGFLDFSFSELAIIFGLALVVLGPKKLPGLVQQVGRWVGRARHMARQFREQLEQEVNAINEVKPVPRHTAAEVGPAAPGTTAPPDVHTVATSTEATGVPTEAVPASPAEVEGAAPASAPANDLHPEAQIYFAMNGSEPALVAQDPYAPAVDVEPHVAADPAASDAAATPAAARPAEPAAPVSVEVVFPHDHA